MPKSIKVLIVDNKLRARQGMRALIATCPGVAEIREATNGLEAILRIQESPPDVVLIDILMPIMDGLEATRLIKERWNKIRIIALSMYDEYSEKAREAGADEFITKGESAERLLTILSKWTVEEAQPVG